MKALIVEDEILASDRLMSLLKEADPTIEILAVLDSVKSVVQWLEQNDEPELLFLDIHLADGSSFEIFKKRPVNCPIIFTTAYDQYALDAFKVNSLDYLLKPIDPKELKRALGKFKPAEKPTITFDPSLLEAMLHPQKQYKERFIVKVGEHIKSILSSEITAFYSLEKTTYLLTKEGKKFLVDYPLDQLEELVNPARFFRINRKYIVEIDAIKDIISFSSHRLKLDITHLDGEDTIVAKERVGGFKEWLDR